MKNIKKLLVVFSLLIFSVGQVSAVSFFGSDTGNEEGWDYSMGDLANDASTVSGVISSASGVVSSIGGAVNSICGLTNSVRSIFGKDPKCGAGGGGGLLGSGGGDSTYGLDGKFELPEASKFNTIGENISARAFILNVLNFFLSFLGLIAIIAIIFAGYQYVTAMGDDGKIESSKKIITYAVVGILVVLISFALVNTVIKNAGSGGQDRGEVENSGRSFSELPSSSDLFLVEENGVRKFGNAYIVPMASAKAGLKFRLKYPAYGKIFFGDNSGGDISQEGVTHAYVSKGEYTATAYLKPEDSVDWGSVQEVPVSLKLIIGSTVTPVIIMSKGQANLNEIVTVTGAGSTVAPGAGQISNYKWEFEKDNAVVASVSGKTVYPAFDEVGDYTIRLIVNTNLGAEAVAEMPLKIVDPNNLNPLNVDIQIN